MSGTIISKVSDKEYEASLECPWCGVTSSSRALPAGTHGDNRFFVASCQARSCARPALLRISDSPFSAHERTTWGAQVFPTSQVTYSPIGVPADIARDFKEALACHAAGHNYAAALVARRVLQAAARDASGGPGANLATEINAIPPAKLSQVLKEAAHEVRYIGNDAAHAAAIDSADVTHLLVFTEQLLEALYVMPAKVAAARAKRTGPATPSSA